MRGIAFPLIAAAGLLLFTCGCESSLAPPSVNHSPNAIANGPYTGTAGQAVAFSSTGSTDPDGDPLSYSWDFGDAMSAGTGASPMHIYQTAGTYALTLTVSDNRGGSAAASSKVTVRLPNAIPVAQANGPYLGTVGKSIAF